MEQQIRQAVENAFSGLQDTVLRREFRALNSKIDGVNSRLDSRIDGTETFMRQEFQRTNSRIDRTEAFMRQEFQCTNSRIDRTEAFMRQEFQRTNSRIDRTEAFMQQEFQQVRSSLKSAVDGLNSRMGNLEVVVRNSKILSLSQRIHPLPVYNPSTQKLLPVPKEFPSTALRLYNLQYQRNWENLASLLVYYHLEPALMELVHTDSLLLTADINLDSDFDFKSDSNPTRSELLSAIESNAWGAVTILGSHLGVDCDTIQDKIMQFEFKQKRALGQKRQPEDSPDAKVRAKRIVPVSKSSEDESWKKRINEAAKDGVQVTPPKKGDSSSGQNTKVSWKNESGQVLQHYQDMGYGPDMQPKEEVEEVEEERKSASAAGQARSHRGGSGTPSTKAIPSSEIEQNLG